MTEPIRVLYVLNAMGGGASLGIYESIPALRERGILPYAITPPGSDAQYTRMRPLFEDVEITPMNWWNVEYEVDPVRKTARAFGRWRRGINVNNDTDAVEACIDKWDIDIVHSGTSLTLCGALAAKSRHKPHIWHIKETVGSPNRVHFNMPDDQLVRYMDDLSAQIVPMSDYIAGIFRQYGSQKVTVLPDGVILEPYLTGESRQLRAKLGLRDDQLLVGMVASLVSTWKRHEVFIRMAGLMAADHPDVHFLIIGGKPSPNARWPYDLNLKYYQNLERVAAEVAPPGRLTLMDHFPDPADIMRSLDVLVHTCDIEPFGRIAIEAMASGTPVVAPSTGGLSETIVNGVTGLHAIPNDPASFAKATAKLLADQGVRDTYGAAGRARAQKEYNADLYADRLLAIYNAVR